MTVSPLHLMTLGMFVFGMDTVPYDDLVRRVSWRHGDSERFQARAASQFLGPGEDSVIINGLIVPEIAGTYSSLDTLRAMGDTGDSWQLLDGLGRVLGQYRLESVEEGHRGIMAGGIPRGKAVSIELKRVD